MYGLGCMLVESRSLEVSSDYWVYMDSSPLAWLLSRSLIDLSSYNLDGSVTVVDIDKGKFCICAASNHISTNQVVRNVHLAIEGRNYSLDLVILRSLG
jgi:hypothetical protein